MLNCCIFCMNLPLLIFQQAFCCPILKQWSWKLAVGSLFIFSLQHPGFCNLTSTHGIWQDVLLVNLERQSDCRRTVVELRYQCGRSACQRPQLTDGAPLKYCQLLLLLKLPWCQSSWDTLCQICGNMNSLCLKNWYFFDNFHRMSIEKP